VTAGGDEHAVAEADALLMTMGAVASNTQSVDEAVGPISRRPIALAADQHEAGHQSVRSPMGDQEAGSEPGYGWPPGQGRTRRSVAADVHAAHLQ
jgi:hypothetical protein